MKKIRLLINTIRFSFIVGIVILVFIGERSRIMAMFGGIFLLLSVVEFILQFLCEIDERRKNGESDIYKAKAAAGLCVRCGARLEKNSPFLKCGSCIAAEREEREKKYSSMKKKGGLSLKDVMTLAAENHCTYGEMVVRLQKEVIG